ncbi:uncharacterized protein EV154DRAFT_485628 [Mucor mucedo]|uniref:uncharacterized protein n=1 Tax=Mucor mucedo TaxID=29922 RepID=UPI00221FA1DF|nr:uncharacterized protein EV154DRAFT_485628 [Mucor mucedo]KAI7882299.1 hypothetical protein EV154DRAFT_485628 [Mucor mucedo]
MIQLLFVDVFLCAMFCFVVKVFVFLLLEKLDNFFSFFWLKGTGQRLPIDNDIVGEITNAFVPALISTTTTINNFPVVSLEHIAPTQTQTTFGSLREVGPSRDYLAFPPRVEKEFRCLALWCACLVGGPCAGRDYVPSPPSEYGFVSRSSVPSWAYACEYITRAWMQENNVFVAPVSSVVNRPRKQTYLASHAVSFLFRDNACCAVSFSYEDNALSTVSSPAGDNVAQAVSSSYEDNASCVVSSSYEDNTPSAVSFPYGDNAAQAVSSSSEDNASCVVSSSYEDNTPSAVSFPYGDNAAQAVSFSYEDNASYAVSFPYGDNAYYDDVGVASASSWYPASTTSLERAGRHTSVCRPRTAGMRHHRLRAGRGWYRPSPSRRHYYGKLRLRAALFACSQATETMDVDVVFLNPTAAEMDDVFPEPMEIDSFGESFEVVDGLAESVEAEEAVGNGFCVAPVSVPEAVYDDHVPDQFVEQDAVDINDLSTEAPSDASDDGSSVTEFAVNSDVESVPEEVSHDASDGFIPYSFFSDSSSASGSVSGDRDEEEDFVWFDQTTEANNEVEKKESREEKYVELIHRVEINWEDLVESSAAAIIKNNKINSWYSILRESNILQCMTIDQDLICCTIRNLETTLIRKVLQHSRNS